MATYVLGLSYSHDASACLLRDGVPVVAIQKERITRIKHDGDIRDIDLTDCIEYCLTFAGITLDEISLVVENSPTILYCKHRSEILGYCPSRLLDRMDQKKIVQISHHLAHAYCAYGSSPFEDCAVLVVDGQGNYIEDLVENLSRAAILPAAHEPSFIERQSYYSFSKGRCRVLRKDLGAVHNSFVRINGLGQLYERVSGYVFRSRYDAGKLMGLAPYGKVLRDCSVLSRRRNGEILYHSEWNREYRRAHPSPRQLRACFGEYADLAATVQHALEVELVNLSRWLRTASRQTKLAYAGGVALNCSANELIANQSGFEDFFITPPASDCGVSIGCAYYGYLHLLKGRKRSAEYTDYLGKTYSRARIERALAASRGVRFKLQSEPAHAAAEVLSEGRVIGWFQGGSEFGPRALGHRSILADPRSPRMRDHINSAVKGREWFRPLAPATAEEYAEAIFGLRRSPYMLRTATVSRKWRCRIPAVVHVDGSARVQTVSRMQNALFHELIGAFGARTGVPVVLNTSFNSGQEPIVETPEDAIRSFKSMQLDELFLGEYRVWKR